MSQRHPHSFTQQGHCFAATRALAGILPTFQPWMHIQDFPVLAAEICDRIALPAAARPPPDGKKINKFCGVSGFIWATILSADDAYCRDRNLPAADALPCRRCGACSIWVRITAYLGCANSSASCIVLVPLRCRTPPRQRSRCASCLSLLFA